MTDKNISVVTKQRDRTFDIAKGIGIIAMLLGHVWSELTPNIHQFVYTFHMPLFFIIAGYFSKSFESWGKAKSDIRHFFKRLWIPFAITQIAIVLWCIVLAYAKDGSWNGVITNALSIFWADPSGPQTPWGRLGIGVTWFLVALLTAKILLLLLSRLKGWAIPISLILSISAIIIHPYFPYSIWCISLAFTALPFVVVGWWFRTHPIPKWLIAVCIICWVASFFISHLDMYEFIYHCYPLDVLGACGGTWVIIALSRWIGKKLTHISSILAHLGVISLYIMCIHHFEMCSHMGNHIKALLGIELSIGWLYVWRYALTILAAIALDLTIKTINLQRKNRSYTK